MNINFTARHFKARQELQDFAEDAVNGLTHLYDGIVSADVILEEETPSANGRVAEIGLLVYKDKLFAKERSDEYMKAISACIEKLERQLMKYKDKMHDGRHPHERVEPEPTDNTLDLI